MQPSIEQRLPPGFAGRLRAASSSLLLLDYDGTLAPFQLDRSRAYPYPRILPLLAAIRDAGRSRVVIVTGRPIADLCPLLAPLHNVEIWGSYGLEHLSPEGIIRQTAIASTTAALLSQAESWLAAAGLAERTEVKPGGLAVHWRGLSDAETGRIRASTQETLRPLAMGTELELFEFDGGLELRVAHPHKGDAVGVLLQEVGAEIPVAYLGDDFADENAFRVLNAKGGLSVLVRPEQRETLAQLWLQPPEQLVAFLNQWLDCLGAR